MTRPVSPGGPALPGGPAPAARLAHAPAYAPPKPPGAITLKLDANEGPDFSAHLAPLLATALAHPNRYPKPADMETHIARRLGLSPANVLVTAGVDDGLMRFALAFLESGRNALLTRPTFEMIPRYIALAGGEARAIPWPEGDFPIDAALRHIDARTGAVFLVTPNNPTGLCAQPADLADLARAAPHAAVALDLAYGEYNATTTADLAALARVLPNVVTFRTFSKAWGLAGFRVGYAVGPAELLAPMRAAGNPYAVSRAALAVAHAWFDAGEPRMREAVLRSTGERAEIARALADLGFAVVRGLGNFVFARERRPGDAERLHAALGERGIAVRLFRADAEPSDPQPGAVRITTPCDAASLRTLLDALSNALPENQPAVPTEAAP